MKKAAAAPALNTDLTNLLLTEDGHGPHLVFTPPTPTSTSTPSNLNLNPATGPFLPPVPVPGSVPVPRSGPGHHLQQHILTSRGRRHTPSSTHPRIPAAAPFSAIPYRPGRGTSAAASAALARTMSFAIEVPGGANPLTFQHLCRALESATTSQAYAQRQAAEQQLQEWQTHPGYYSSLQVRAVHYPLYLNNQLTTPGCLS